MSIRTQAKVKGIVYTIIYVRSSPLNINHTSIYDKLQQTNRLQLHTKLNKNQWRHLRENECRKFFFLVKL